MRRERGRGGAHLFLGHLGQPPAGSSWDSPGSSTLLFVHRVLQRAVEHGVRIAQEMRRHAGHGAGQLAGLEAVLGHPVTLLGGGREHRIDGAAGGRWACSSSAVGSRTSKASPMKLT